MLLVTPRSTICGARAARQEIAARRQRIGRLCASACQRLAQLGEEDDRPSFRRSEICRECCMTPQGVSTCAHMYGAGRADRGAGGGGGGGGGVVVGGGVVSGISGFTP